MVHLPGHYTILYAGVFNVLRHRALLESAEGPSLVAEFVQSRAFGAHADDLACMLEDLPGSLVPYARVIGEVVRRLAGWSSSTNRDPALRFWGLGGRLGLLLLRLYEQAEGCELKDVRVACLDTWDEFLRGRLDLVQKVLGDLDA